ncbi:NADP-dependent 3-hydroxy acid dehydrogenase YdfG [Streptomyces sp. 1114.5]|uniref:SDR family oxidoreductase n=1 Tax=unclassified Streptomyces TaxID=2593676 RepID=UPI000BC71F44|nr:MULTISPECIES: SDR family oxidoreductase [unclassified Streptomyces]RKT17096.1 NADP-dependent 3-hydroxy acid dehydrogenase YdfG [Streptomyces sp. 1114.5]SOB83306.1 NADP-dependent 3-hydroxy acid dehydrogenase YdfG [Streptomyces sp. 1331.2]
MSYPDLATRTAVVTGAASGMGAATARALAAHGARVALLARRTDRLDALAAEIAATGGQALPVTADITDQASVDAAAKTVHDAYGRVDLVVNNAGVMLPNPLADGRIDEWTRMVDTNLTGALRIVRAFTADLTSAAADGRTADLVNVSSIASHVVFPDYAVYGATKAALTQLSAALRSELGPRDVRVSAIEPGLTDTELGEHIDNPVLRDQLGGMFTAIPALGAEDVADLVAYTVSRPRHVNLRHLVVLPTRQA